MWDIATGKFIRDFDTPRPFKFWWYDVVFLPDDRRFVTADVSKGGAAPTALALWDADTGTRLDTFQGHTDAIIAVALTPDGRQALTGGLDRSVRVWNLPGPAKDAELGWVKLSPRAGKPSPDQNRLQGDWSVVLGEMGGKPLPPEQFKKLEIRFDGDKFEMVRPGQNPERRNGTFKVDPGKKQLIFQFKDAPVGVPVSYRTDGERLRLTFEGLRLDPGVGELVGPARLTADRVRSLNNLKQIALEMVNYHETNKALPPAALYSKDGKPLLSWRVALLPYLQQEVLYKAFKLDEPWDSEHNKKLIAQMPAVYATPGGKEAKFGMTHYQVFVGAGTAFEPRPQRRHGIEVNEILDGTSNTLLVVEATDAVIWTRPDDLPFDPRKAPPKLGIAQDAINVVFCDGSTASLLRDVTAETLKALITRSGGEKVSPPLVKQELLPTTLRLRLEFERKVGGSFVPLLGGKDLTGWDGDLKRWTVNKGVLEGGSGFLHTGKKYEDFELRLEYRVSPMQSIKPPPTSPTLWIQLDQRGKDKPTAGIAVTLTSAGGPAMTPAGGAKIHDLVEHPLKKLKRLIEWNEVRIICNQGKLTLWVNGELRRQPLPAAPTAAQSGCKRAPIRCTFATWQSASSRCTTGSAPNQRRCRPGPDVPFGPAAPHFRIRICFSFASSLPRAVQFMQMS